MSGHDGTADIHNSRYLTQVLQEHHTHHTRAICFLPREGRAHSHSHPQPRASISFGWCSWFAPCRWALARPGPKGGRRRGEARPGGNVTTMRRCEENLIRQTLQENEALLEMRSCARTPSDAANSSAKFKRKTVLYSTYLL
jgi:hypothetical protein